nr:hypothetical protein [Halomonas sp. 1513]
MINRYFLKGQYNSGNKFFEGIVVRERTEAMDNYHYHIMLADGETILPDYDSLESVVNKKIQTLNKSRTYGNKINKFLLQEYYDTEGSSLERYVTKAFENTSNSINDCSDAICPIQHAGVSFND